MANITDEMFLASLNGAGNVDYGAHEISDGGGDGFLDSLNGGSVDNVDASHQPKTATTDPHSLGFVERHGTESAAQTGVDLDEVYGTNGIGGVLGGTAKALNSVAPFAGTAGRAIAGSRQKSLDTALETGEAGSLSAIDTDEWDKTEGAKYDLYQRALNGDKDADYSPIYAQRFDKKSGRYVIDRDENGNPYLNEKYSGSKDEARKAFVKELAASQIAQTAETKYRAQKDLENNTAPWYMGLAHGATASLGFAGEFYLGGALAKGVLGAAALSGTKLGTAAKIAEAGGKLGLKGRMALSATELAAPTVANAIARYENLTADDYRMDDNGNVNLAERGDGAIKGAMKAAGGAAFENVVEVALGKMVNKVFGATCKGIYNKVPGIKKLFDGAMDKVGDKAVDSAKKAWIRATKTYAEVQKAAHFELMPVGEFAEEYVQGYGDEVLGLDVRDDADAKGLGEFTKDFFSWDANGKDLFYGVMGQTIALGLGTHAMRRAHDFKNSVDAKVLGALKLHGYNNADIAKMGTNTRLALAMQLSDGNAVKEMGYSVQDYADMLGVKQREVEKYGENIKLISNKEEFGKLTPEQQAKISGEVLQFQQVMYAAASSFEVGIDGATEMMNGLNKRMRKYIMLMEERQGLGNYRNNVGTKPQDFVSRVDWSGSTDSAGNINWQTDENTGRQYIESVPFSNDGFGVRVFREGDKFRVVHPQGMNQNGYLADDLKEAHDYAASLDQFAQKRNKDREIMQEYVRFNANRLVPTQTDKKTGKKIGAPVVTANNAMDAVNNLGWLTENDKTKLAAAAQDGTEGGGFKTEDGTVLILLDNLRDTNDALLTLAHEIGGHAAIAEGVKDKGLSLAETIAEVYKTSKTKDTKQAQTEYRIRRTEGEDKNVARAAAQEEGMVYGNEYRIPVASPLQKAKTAVKLWMKQHGMDAKLTDDDYIAIASSGLARIEQTRTGDTETESVDDNGITVTPTVRGTDLKNKHESGKWVSDYYAQREKLDEARAAQDAAEAAKRNADAAAKEQAKIDKAVADEEERQRKIAEAEQMRKDAEHATKYGREMVADVLNGWYGSKGIKPEQVERIVNGATNEEIAELLDFIELEMDGKASEGSVLEVAKKINKDIAGRTVSDKQKAQREKFAKSAKEKAANERRMKEQFIEDMGLQNSVFEYYWLENHGALFSEPVLKKVESKGVKFADRKADYYTYGNDGLDILFDGLHGNARLRMRRFLFGSGTQSQYDPAAFKAGLSTDDRPHGGIDLEIEALIKYVTGDIDADVSSHRYFNNVVDIVADLNDQNDKYQQWLKGEIGPEAEARYEQWRIDEERRIELEAAEVDNVDLADAHEAWGDVVAVSADGKPIADPSALKSGDGILVPNEDGVDVALRVVSNENGIIKIADESGAETFDFEWNKERGDWEAVEERDDANDYADEIDEFYESKNKEDGNGETNEELDEGGQDGDSAENTGLPEPQAAERDTGTDGGKDRRDGKRTEASFDNAAASEDDALNYKTMTKDEILHVIYGDYRKACEKIGIPYHGDFDITVPFSPHATKGFTKSQLIKSVDAYRKKLSELKIEPATDKQISFIKKLASEKEWSVIDARNLNKYTASYIIGVLKAEEGMMYSGNFGAEDFDRAYNVIEYIAKNSLAPSNANQSLTLDGGTAHDIAAEQKRVSDRKEIERRQNAPLKSGTGEVGQSLMDLGGAEGEDLFNRMTYDDNGNVIPLSERFNPEKSDIRWRRRYTPDPLARRLADIRTLSTLVNGTDHMTEADRLRLSRLSSAILMRTEKMMRELQQQGSVSPELRDILTKARSNKPSEKISGIRSALFSTHGLSRIRERLQDAQISLLEMERAFGIDLANSAYYQFDRNFGKVAKAMKDLERKIIKPLADEIRKNDIDTDELNLYLLALHGAERNRMIAERSPYVLAALNDPRTAPIVQKILAGTGGKTELNEQDILNISTILGWVDKNGNRTEDSKQFEKDLMGSGATTAWWNEKLADFNKSGFDAKAKKAVDLIRELTKMNRDLLVQSGRLNAKQAALWEKLSPNYVPMRSDMDMDTDIWGKWLLGGGAESNNGGRKYTNEEYKHAYGRGTIADDPISFAIQQYEESLGRAWDNVARQRLADIVRANPNIGKVFRYENLTTTKRARYAKAIAIIENKVKNGTATPDEIKRMNWYREALNADGSIPTTKVLGQNGVMHTVPTLSAIEGSGKKSTNIIAFKEDGNLKFIKLGGFKQDQINANPNLLDDVTAKRIAAAVKKHNMAQINGLMRAMRKATGYFSALRTALSPTFVVSNLGADNTQALRNIYATFGAGAMTKFEHYAYHSFGAAKAVLNDNYNGTAIQKYAEEWADNGGMIGGLAVENIKDLRKGVDGIVRRLASQKNQLAKIHDIKSFLAWAKDRGSDFADFAEKYNSIVEMSTRIAAYATARDMGKSIEEAVSYARDITVNFNRKGTETPWINALYAFSNATMQDIQRSIVAFSEGEYGKGTGLLAKRGAIMSVGLMFLGFMASLFGYWQDDPEDEKEGKGQWKYAKEYQKQNVMGARVMGKTIGVPIRGLSRIPYYLGHQIYEAMTGRKSAASLAADTASLAVENMTDFLGSSSDIGQTLIPSVARPYFEIKNNKTFTGSPMYREALPGQEETAVRSEMGRGGTSDAAKWVAKMLNAATGGSKYERGTIDVQPEKIAAVWNWLFGSAGKDIANISGFVMDTATGKLLERDIRNVPYLSRFVRNLDENSADFYKARDKYEIALKKFNGMTGEDGNEDAVRELVADNPWLSTRGSGKRWGTELKDLNGAVQKLLQIEKGLDGEEYDNIHQLRLKAQYQFMRRLEKSPSEDAEGVSAEREHKKAYAPLLRSSKRDSKQEQREQKKRKRLF